ncbi:Lipin/Ned1/Smp2-domain-containing protein [Zychaea mexicana]|uniref:Lipin/Ned1/Smp2-domain-containing protein n=1 Tax=Zychaea mexicana TaxID=64656 RepID=UPI0022FE41A0|nr:Lipin/Ned1/Smp2-domain-containing protein [Zychaea mexicana]KAI9489466.1 Lipin/Ned1/Smp2-domain-containing protein [Zychaea mexicana]
MEYVGRISNLITTVHQFYNDINPATLSGAIDIVVVRQQNGELACSPFHVRFGKLSLLMPQEKKVEIEINGQVIPYMMKLGEAGEAFFVFETEHEVPEEFQTSPIMQAEEETQEDEEPPYLDIGESKTPTKDQQKSNDVAADGFDDETDKKHTTLRIPAELQSPKMIIEEQVDKVVTKMDPFLQQQQQQAQEQQHDQGDNIKDSDNATHEAQNDVYPMEDGATLLERCIPEAITSTTVAKETFIVRPADGDIYSTWMDVTHTSVHTRNAPTEPTSPRQGDAESIFLDIAGYKTENDDDKIKAEDLLATPTTEVERSLASLQVDTTAKKGVEEEKQSAQEEQGINGSSTEAVTAATTTAAAEEKELGSLEEQPQEALQQQINDIKLTPGETYRIELSLCSLVALGSDEEKNAEIFDKEQLTYDNFVHNPNLLNDRRLVFRHRNRYYASSHAGPLFTSLLLFRKPLAEVADAVQEDPTQQQVSDSRDTYSFGRGWRQWLSRSSIAAGGGAAPSVASTPAMTPSVEGAAGDMLSIAAAAATATETEANETTTFTTTTKTTSVGWSPNHTHPDEEPLDFPVKNYAKTLRLTSEQLKSLNLKKGANNVCFSVTSAYQGKATCTAKVFFWDYDVNIVISDIDGTITKSDALGHMFNFIGKDWTHTGVAKLYTDVEKNGYQFLYLTSRAIGQADSTRDYLQRVQQNQYQLPEGPVIMSPDRLFTSFHREVIMRKPEVFKMACLRDVLRLFGGKNPFYAGFGNRITDAISYRSVDVPASRIFTIDANGELKLELLTGFKSSYLHLNDLVDQIFPPINKAIHEEFSDYNFWKAPLPEIELPDEETQPTPTSPKTKPKPIVSDPSALPPQSVVASTPPPSRQRGILRSFTSRSSTTTTTTSSSTSLSSTASITAAATAIPAYPSSSSLKIAASSSTPALSTTTTYSPLSSSPPARHSATTPPPVVGSPIEPSSPLTSVASTDDPTTPVDGSSGGIVNKVLGGVFSRTFASKSTTNVSSTTYEDYEEADDDAFDSTLDAIADEIDMDNIPFI